MATLVTLIAPRRRGRSAHHRTPTVREPRSSELCAIISDRDERQPTVGPARLPIDQPAGWVRRPSAARLDGMTTETLVLPDTAPAVAPATPRPRGCFRQLGIDTGYLLVSF